MNKTKNSKQKSRAWKKPVIKQLPNAKGETAKYWVRKSANGNRVSRTFKTLEEAEAYIAELEASRYRIITDSEGNQRLTLKALLDKWSPYKISKSSEATFRTFEIAFRKYWRDKVGDCSLNEIDEEQFEDVMAQTYDLSPSRRSQIARVIKEINDFARKRLKHKAHQLLQFEIDIRDIREAAMKPSGRIVFIRTENLESYVSAFRNTRHRQTWLVHLNELLLGTGIRIGEAACLQWDQFRENERVLRINRHISLMRDKRTGKYAYAIKPGTKSGLAMSRDVPLSDDMAETLRSLRKRAEEIKRKFNVPDNNFIFIPDNPRRSRHPHVAYATMRNSLSYTMKKVASEDLTPHTLRHTFATDFIKTVGKVDGNAARYAQRILGHASPTMTNHYTHLTEEDAVEGMQAYDKLKKSRSKS
jgi:integrase